MKSPSATYTHSVLPWLARGNAPSHPPHTPKTLPSNFLPIYPKLASAPQFSPFYHTPYLEHTMALLPLTCIVGLTLAVNLHAGRSTRWGGLAGAVWLTHPPHTPKTLPSNFLSIYPKIASAPQFSPTYHQPYLEHTMALLPLTCIVGLTLAVNLAAWRSTWVVRRHT